jgi:hypothetical protein
MIGGIGRDKLSWGTKGTGDILMSDVRWMMDDVISLTLTILSQATHKHSQNSGSRGERARSALVFHKVPPILRQ